MIKHSFNRFLIYIALLFIVNADSFAQITIYSEGFNNSSTYFTLTSGAYYTGNSAAGDRPASAPFASEGTHSRGISNGTATLLSSQFNTLNYTSLFLSFKLSSFSINSTGNGADGADIVRVEISPDGGATFYSTLRILGNSNAYWDYSASGNASTAYDGDITPIDFIPSGGGSRTTDGFSSISVNNLPSINNLVIRIVLLNNSSNERWLIDDFKIIGTPTSGPEINITANNTSITDGDTSPSTTDHTDFGSACETSGTVTRTFTIENTGVNDLTVSSINLSGTNAADFSVSGITLPATIAASSSTTFSVTFDPSATGTRTATISLANDDTNENPYDFSIQGTGTASALITSPVSGSPFCLDPDAAVNVSFTSSCITFNGANIFTAQLSDNTGSFASPTVIGTLSSSATSGTISATIPSGTPTGTGYRIRVVSSSPAYTANDNGSDLSISSSPCVLQVPYITAVLINSCDGTCTEGQNEIVFLNSGDYSIPVSPSDIILKYQSTSPPSTTYTDGFTSNTSYINTLNDSANCGTLFYDALTVGTIPANSAFLIMRQDPCYGYNFNSFCGGGPIYVLFSTDGSWQTSGNFVNSDNDATPERYFRTDFTASIPGSVIDYNYDASVIVNADGAGVTYGPTGGDPTSYFNNNDCTPPPIVLPIDLIHFTATPKSSSVHLSWVTATEINNDYFTLLRSHDGKAFSELTQIPGKGNSNTVNEYYFTDENPLKGTSYYRLKQTDFDGASSMSEIVPVKFDSGSSEISITQNEELIFITVHKDNSKYINSVLISLSGQRIFEETFSGSGTYTIKKPSTKGLYILSVTTAASQTSQKIIVH